MADGLDVPSVSPSGDELSSQYELRTLTEPFPVSLFQLSLQTNYAEDIGRLAAGQMSRGESYRLERRDHRP